MKKKPLTTAKPKRTKLIVTDRKLVQVTMQIFEDQKEALAKLSNKIKQGKKTPMQTFVQQALDKQGLCNSRLIAQ